MSEQSNPDQKTLADLAQAKALFLRNIPHPRRNLMRVIVCGGRNYDDRAGLFEAMDCLHDHFGITLVIQGGATGADQLAYEWAASRMIMVENVPADWKKHGRAAGPVRNRAMLDRKPAIVIAFPGGRGTADMMRQAREARVPVYRPTHGGTTA